MIESNRKEYRVFTLSLARICRQKLIDGIQHEAVTMEFTGRLCCQLFYRISHRLWNRDPHHRSSHIGKKKTTCSILKSRAVEAEWFGERPRQELFSMEWNQTVLCRHHGCVNSNLYISSHREVKVSDRTRLINTYRMGHFPHIFLGQLPRTEGLNTIQLR